MLRSRFMRTAMLIGAGGLLLQAGGCGVTLAPLALSVLESLLLSALTGQFVGGL